LWAPESSSWAAEYLARGFDVVANDPAPNAEANLRKYVDDGWEQLKVLGFRQVQAASG